MDLLLSLIVFVCVVIVMMIIDCGLMIVFVCALMIIVVDNCFCTFNCACV